MAECLECGAVIAEGCACSVADSDCIATDGDGSLADPFTFSPIIDPAAGNLAVCGATGLGAFLPDELADPPTCRVYSSVNQNILTATDVALTFNQERFDTDTMHSNVTDNSRITFTTGGVYVMTFCMTWEANATGDRKIRIRLNGATIIVADEKSSDQNDDFDHTVSTIYKVAAGDYIEAYVAQNSGVTLQSIANGNYAPEMAVARVAVG